jgi:large-conductance mechanosensitive channel
MNSIKKKSVEEAPPPSKTEALLEEIRDLLKK